MIEPKKLSTFGDEGPNGKPIVRVVTNAGHVPIGAGFYRLVCGVPRKFWSLGSGDGAGLLEAYRYEVVEKIKTDLGTELEDESSLDRVRPAEALEIEGRFDPDGNYWPAGAHAKVRWPLTGTIGTIDLPDWRFTLYEGDRLYRPDGELV